MLFARKIWNGIGLGLSCIMMVLLGCNPQSQPTQTTQTESVVTPEPLTDKEEIVATSPSPGKRLELIVEVDGFASNQGACRVAVYLGKAHFNDLNYAVAKESIAVRDSKAEVHLELEYPDSKDPISIAVCAYHDENDNSRLDKNSFGIPIERYGFSSNPKRGFGPPKFNEAAIDLDATTLQNESGSHLNIPITIK